MVNNLNNNVNWKIILSYTILAHLLLAIPTLLKENTIFFVFFFFLIIATSYIPRLLDNSINHY